MKTIQSINEKFEKKFTLKNKKMTSDKTCLFEPTTREIKQFFHKQYQQLISETIGKNRNIDYNSKIIPDANWDDGYNQAKAEIRAKLKAAGINI